MLAVIVRGLPGSGKSTLTSKLAKDNNAVVHSTDNYFCVTGEYIFNPKRLGWFHQLNLEDFEVSLSHGKNVICDNTNTTWKEIKPYVKVAKKYGCEILIVESETEWAFDVDVLAERNTHNVSKEIIQFMLDKWETTESIIEKV